MVQVPTDERQRMNHERMLKVADVIEENPDHFDMKFFMKTGPDWTDRMGESSTRELVSADIYNCGTTACIAGWACWLWSAEVRHDKGVDDNAQHILGLSTDVADELFIDFDLKTAKDAAAHLREMVREDLA